MTDPLDACTITAPKLTGRVVVNIDGHDVEVRNLAKALIEAGEGLQALLDERGGRRQ